MKINLLFILFLFCGKLALCEDKEEILSYSVDSIVKDKNLKSGQSKFVFTSKFLDTRKNNKLIYSYNGSANKTAVLDSKKQFTITLPSGSYSYVFYYSGLYFEIYTNSISVESQNIAYISLNWEESSTHIMVEKPVIYLYPEELTDIEVKLHPKDELTFTYPTYHGSWKFKADPSGKLSFDNQQFSYLFWESKQRFDPTTLNMYEGFVVEKDHTVHFLDSTLSLFGFNDQEKEDFITYWGPQLIQNEQNFIQFIINEECDQFCELEISPQPDNIYRIYMISKKIESLGIQDVKPQRIHPIKRKGFTVLEWGGFILESNRLKSFL